ncbi:MAG: DUF1573 domain-containing protein [Thermoguttaceae bacterium]
MARLIPANRIATLALGVLAGIGGFAPSAPGQDWARELFAATSHDFGSVARAAKAEYSFVISNRFKADIHVASAQSSCGCTTPMIAKQWLKPYETGAIVAHLNSGSYLGRRHATVTVTIDQPAYAQVQLQVSAYVHDDVLMEPSSVELGSVDHGSAGDGKVLIYRADRPDWTIFDVRSDNPYLSSKVTQLGRQNGQVWYELRVHLNQAVPVGYINEHVILVTNDPAASQLPVLVEGQVVPEISVSPNSLFLGDLQPGQKVTRQLVVRGKRPFRILGITADPASFELPQFKKDAEARPVHLVPVTFIAGAEWGKVVKTLHIQTDLDPLGAEAAAYAVVEPSSVPITAENPSRTRQQ